MRKKLKDIIARKINPIRTRAPMNTIVLILLGIVIVATLAFLVSLFRLSLDDADFWLKVISGVLAAFTFLAGAAALVTGTVLGNRQSEKILTLGTTLEKERQTRLELEEAVAPRRIRRPEEMAERLKEFAGTNVIMEALLDPESRLTALQINKTLGMAGWKGSGINITQDTSLLFQEWVDIEVATGIVGKDDHSTDAAALLVEQLAGEEIEAIIRAASTPLPPNTIRIRVGMKPNTYILTPEEKKEREERARRMIEYWRNMRENTRKN